LNEVKYEQEEGAAMGELATPQYTASVYVIGVFFISGSTSAPAA
jgi:hypothetical protein